MSNEKIPVYLLKNPSEPVDKYHELISSADNGRYMPVFVPVLEHSLLKDGVEEISKLLLGHHFISDSPHRTYGGIIFTSQRAVIAFAAALEQIKAISHDAISTVLDRTTSFYVVGQATCTALEALNLPCPIKGQDTGNGKALAAFILEEYSHDRGSHDLLFMVGETRRDIIPRTLQSETLPVEQRIRVNEIEVYKSVENTKFAQNFQQEVTGRSDGPNWVVVFSPTGCKSMLETLGLLDSRVGRYNGTAVSTRIATIGPTTKDHLIREFHFVPHAVAAKPMPEALVKSILDAS